MKYFLELFWKKGDVCSPCLDWLKYFLFVCARWPQQCDRKLVAAWEYSQYHCFTSEFFHSFRPQYLSRGLIRESISSFFVLAIRLRVTSHRDYAQHLPADIPLRNFEKHFNQLRHGVFISPRIAGPNQPSAVCQPRPYQSSWTNFY